MPLPRVLLVPYLKGWTYDMTAAAMVRHLSYRFEFRVAYESDIKEHFRAHVRYERSEIDEWNPDVVVDMWWHGTLEREFGRRTVKQISSHRWATSEKFGACTPEKLISRYADNVGVIVVPSKRLAEQLAGVVGDRPLLVARKGFEPDAFARRRGHEPLPRSRDRIIVGWAGASDAKDKGLDILRAVEPELQIADACSPARIPYETMPAFYNSLDIIAIASDAEGDPRPLIEAMACACFPVTTDVGIAPELIDHGRNGLIVERSIEAFRDAFAWCRRNPVRVRTQGSDNARMMSALRTWAQVMPEWGRALDLALERSREVATPAYATT